MQHANLWNIKQTSVLLPWDTLLYQARFLKSEALIIPSFYMKTETIIIWTREYIHVFPETIATSYTRVGNLFDLIQIFKNLNWLFNFFFSFQPLNIPLMPLLSALHLYLHTTAGSNSLQVTDAVAQSLHLPPPQCFVSCYLTHPLL